MEAQEEPDKDYCPSTGTSLEEGKCWGFLGLGWWGLECHASHLLHTCYLPWPKLQPPDACNEGHAGR